jgi:hypothetical protein
LSPSSVSSLLIIWSVATFTLEVPSGAWADLVDRRLLLALSGPTQAAGFVVWLAWPGYGGFAIGFLLWAMSSALASGTFEAFVYDELASTGRAADFPRVLGWANAGAVAGAALGIAAGGPLYALGGYTPVGVASIAVACVHGALAWTLPAAPVPVATDGEPARALLGRYVATLRAGVREAIQHRTVRRAAVVAAVLMGVSAYDEYFPLLAREQGVATSTVPVWMGLIGAGEVFGAALAGRADALSQRALGGLVAGAGCVLAIGALAGDPAGLVAIAVGYGALRSATVVGEARLQSQITGRARATVSSTVGFGAEVVAVACYATVAVGAPWWSVGTLVAVLCLPLGPLAIALARTARGT